MCCNTDSTTSNTQTYQQSHDSHCWRSNVPGVNLHAVLIAMRCTFPCTRSQSPLLRVTLYWHSKHPAKCWGTQETLRNGRWDKVNDHTCILSAHHVRYCGWSPKPRQPETGRCQNPSRNAQIQSAHAHTGATVAGRSGGRNGVTRLRFKMEDALVCQRKKSWK